MYGNRISTEGMGMDENGRKRIDELDFLDFIPQRLRMDMDLSEKQLQTLPKRRGDYTVKEPLKAGYIKEKNRLTSELEKIRRESMKKIKLQYKLLLMEANRKEVKARFLRLLQIENKLSTLKIKEQSLFDQVFPILYNRRYIKKLTVLTCRLVCKEWKTSIDEYSQNRLSFEESASASFHSKFHHQNDIPFVINSMEKPQKLIELFQNSEGNPLFSGFLSVVDVATTDLRQSFQDEVLKLFVCLGKSISRLYLELYGLGPKEFYQNFAKLLFLSPNLRELVISCCRFPPLKNWRIPYLTAEFKDLLYEVLVNLPVPKMTNLELLACDGVPLPVINGMLQKYRETLKIIVLKTSEKDMFINLIKHGSFPNLEYLNVEAFCVQVDKVDVDKKQHLPKLKELSLKYNDLLLTFQSSVNVFKNIANTVRETLCHLTIHFMNNNEKVQEINFDSQTTLHDLWMDLPHLQTFDLYLHRTGMANIDFLVPCLSLRKLQVTYSRKVISLTKEDKQIPFAEEQEILQEIPDPLEVIKLTGYKHRMYDSNIWKLLPNLQKLCFVISKEMVLAPPTPESKQTAVEMIGGVLSQLPQYYALYESKVREDQNSVYYTREGYLEHVELSKKENLN